MGIAVKIAQKTLPSRWSIGTNSMTDIVGRAVIVSTNEDVARMPMIVACGVIKRTH